MLPLGVTVPRFAPSADERILALLAACRQSLDSVEAVVRTEGTSPGWVEARLRGALLELRYAGAYAEARRRPPLPAFRPSEHSESKK